MKVTICKMYTIEVEVEITKEQSKDMEFLKEMSIKEINLTPKTLTEAEWDGTFISDENGEEIASW